MCIALCVGSDCSGDVVGAVLQALALTPVIVLKSRKFAALFTLGSLFSMGRYRLIVCCQLCSNTKLIVHPQLHVSLGASGPPHASAVL